jgi:hypothetical protein
MASRLSDTFFVATQHAAEDTGQRLVQQIGAGFGFGVTHAAIAAVR